MKWGHMPGSNGQVVLHRIAEISDTVGKYSFTGHETFPFRYPWLTKGVQGVVEHDDLFVRDDAGTLLGAGKNMVQSIRHWCLALHLIAPVNPTLRDGHMAVTPLGHLLFDEDQGLDQYLEDIGTLWLLHWLLVSNRDRASTWYLAFTRWSGDSFSRDDMVRWLIDTVESQPGTRATLSSVHRDVDVFIRTYLPTRITREAPLEDTFDCPLVELGLLQELERGLFHMTRGPKPTLPDDIFAYALCDYWNRHAAQQQTLSFERILHGAGSPGAAFKLSENALALRLERLPRWTGFSFDDTAGVRVVLRTGTGWSDEDLLSSLRNYYEVVGSQYREEVVQW